MFTFKKIALVGIAGLAAFSMSCSDSDGTDPGGTISNVTLNGGKYWVEITGGGLVEATGENNTITGITVKSDGSGSAAEINWFSEPNWGSISKVDLEDVVNTIDKVCGDETSASKKLKITFTAKFEDGGDATTSAEATVDCSTGSSGSVSIKTVTVGGTGAQGGFVDLDGNTAYTKGDVRGSTTTAAKIDFVYGVVGGLGDIILSPMEFAFETDSTGFDALQSNSAFIVPLSAIAPDQVTAARTALTGGATSIPQETINGFLGTFNLGDMAEHIVGEEGLSPANAVFIVKTSESPSAAPVLYLVAVSEKDGTKTFGIASLKIQ